MKAVVVAIGEKLRDHKDDVSCITYQNTTQTTSGKSAKWLVLLWYMISQNHHSENNFVSYHDISIRTWNILFISLHMCKQAWKKTIFSLIIIGIFCLRTEKKIAMKV